jgi:hypothetical protein
VVIKEPVPGFKTLNIISACNRLLMLTFSELRHR